MELTTTILSITKSHLYKYRYLYLVLISVFSIYILPLLFVQLPLGHDIYFHLTRVEGLSEELKLGHFPARLYSTVYADYGYAAPLFYGDWLLYFPAALVVLGVNVVTAYKTFIMVCAVLAALSMYFSAQVIFENKKVAAFTAVIYSISTYFATDAIIRHANGETQSFIFIPLAFAGLYNIILGDCKKWLLLPLGLCGILVTHTLSAVMSVAFMALFALFFIVALIKQPKRFLYIFASVGIFLLLSASFLFPMLEQLKSSKFIATDGTSASAYGSLATRSMQTIYSVFSVFNNEKIIVDGNKYFIPQGIGLALPVMVGWRIAYRKKTSSAETIAFLVFAVLALFMTTRFFPWESLQSELGTLQFPWRIFIFVTFFVALFGGAVAKKLDGTNALFIFMSVVVVISFFSVCNTLYGSYKNVYNKAAANEAVSYPYLNNIGLGEYLPTGTRRSTSVNGKTVNYFANRGDNITSNAAIPVFDVERKDGILEVSFEGVTASNDGKETYIDLPLILYKGYEVVLETPEGSSELELTYGKNNVIRVYIGNATEGKITAKYTGTAIQKVSFIITVLSFGGIFAYSIILYRKKRRIKPETDPLLELSQESSEPEA